MKKINFFTCCNGIYKNFIPLFILSNLYHNENSFVEVGVDFDDVSNTEPIEFLNKQFKDRFLIRNVKFENYIINNITYKPMPNLVRFITEPKFKSEYVYISDVDIIMLEKNIVNEHIKNIHQNSLLYSNIVRDYTPTQKNKHLTGLHLTKYENYYPIPEYTDLFEKGFFKHDEQFLYELMKKKHGIPNEKSKWRPVHGIHVSPNRKPIGGLDWGMGGKKWKKEWNEFRNTDIFKEIEPKLNSFILDKIKIIDNFLLK